MYRGQRRRELERRARKPEQRERRRLELGRKQVRKDCRNCIRKEQPERCKR